MNLQDFCRILSYTGWIIVGHVCLGTWLLLLLEGLKKSWNLRFSDSSITKKSQPNDNIVTLIISALDGFVFSFLQSAQPWICKRSKIRRNSEKTGNRFGKLKMTEFQDSLNLENLTQNDKFRIWSYLRERGVSPRFVVLGQNLVVLSRQLRLGPNLWWRHCRPPGSQKSAITKTKQPSLFLVLIPSSSSLLLTTGRRRHTTNCWNGIGQLTKPSTNGMSPILCHRGYTSLKMGQILARQRQKVRFFLDLNFALFRKFWKLRLFSAEEMRIYPLSLTH